MILLYHNIIPDHSPSQRYSAGQALPKQVFEQHISWIHSRYKIVSLPEYLVETERKDSLRRKLIALTFDDGLRETFDCVFPFLSRENIPATFFVATSHLEHGPLLWFSYLRGLCFENTLPYIRLKEATLRFQTITDRKLAWKVLCRMAKESGDPIEFCRALSMEHPLPQSASLPYEGMTSEQLVMAAQSTVIEVGAHTKTHPYLDMLSKQEQEREILEGRQVLSNMSGTTVRYFAYPNGDYNNTTLNILASAGYDAAFAVIPQKLSTNPDFEIGRVGIYSQSLWKMQLKLLGVADLARVLGLQVG